MPTKSHQQTIDNPDKEDILKLIEKFQEGPHNHHLQAIIVEYYDGLVRTLARKFSKSKGIFDDLYQVGMIGLISAVKRFDPAFGRSFESFAVPTIVGEIKRFIRDKTWSIHVPRRIKELGPQIRKAAEALTNQLQRSPSVAEIASYLNVTEEEVLETMEMGRSYKALSVDGAIDADQEGGTVTLLDLVGEQDDGFQKINQQMVLDKAFHILTEREKMILVYTYYKNMSQKETGEKLGISQMHVSRLQRRALKKLREAMNMDASEALK